MLKLPTEFINSICNCPGFEEAAFTEAHQTSSPTSIRINPFKPTTLNFNLNTPVPWNKNGFYLEERPNFHVRCIVSSRLLLCARSRFHVY